MFANNPASFALTEARKLAGTEEIRVVDVGCGDPERHGARHRHWGAFQYATSLADLFLESGQDAAAHQCEMALGDGYLRVMPELGAASMAMDDTSAANLQALQAAGVSAGTRFAAAVGAGVKV